MWLVVFAFLGCATEAEERMVEQEQSVEAQVDATKSTSNSNNAPTPPTADDLMAGEEPAPSDVEQQVEQYCAGCHGEDLTGGMGPNLMDEFWIYGGDEASIQRTVREGVHKKGMVRWVSVLSTEELNDLGSYVFNKAQEAAQKTP